MVKCSNCHGKQENGVKCKYCGHTLSDAIPDNNRKINVSSNNAITIIICGFIILLAFCLLIDRFVHFEDSDVQTIQTEEMAKPIGEPQEAEKTPRESKNIHAVDIGEIGILDGGKLTPCATYEKDIEEIINAIKIQDEYGFKELLEQGRLILVPAPVKVKVIKRTWGKIQVRILEGQCEGKAVWVYSVFVKPIK
jgi:hypothetical protein